MGKREEAVIKIAKLELIRLTVRVQALTSDESSSDSDAGRLMSDILSSNPLKEAWSRDHKSKFQVDQFHQLIHTTECSKLISVVRECPKFSEL